MIARIVLAGLIYAVFCGWAFAQSTPKEVELSGAGRYSEVVDLLAGKERSKLPVMSLTCLCGAYFELKRFTELFPCLDSLDKKLGSGERNYFNHDLSAVPELVRAQARLELGQPEKALEHALNAEKIVNQRQIIPYYRIKALGLSGLAYAVLAQSDKALQKTAELAALPLGPQEELILADRALGRARILISLGKSKQALAALDFSPGAITRLAKSLVGRNILLYQELPYEFVKARAELEQGQLDKAKNALDALLSRPGIRDFGSIYRFALYDRGRIAQKQGRAEEAVGYFQRAIEEIERQRLNLDSEIDKIGFVGDKQEVYAAMIALLAESKRPEQAFWYVERAKARAMVDLLAQKMRFSLKSGSQEALSGMLKNLEEAEIAQFAASDPAALEAARTRSAKLRGELKLLDPEVSSLVAVEAANAAQIQALLAPDESLLEYFRQGPDFFLFKLTRSDVSVFRLDSGGLEESVAKLRRQVADPRSSAWQETAKSLHERLLGPLGADKPSPRTLIVAHGPLHYLPFGLLTGGQAYFGDQSALRSLPSATVLRYLAGREAGQGQPLVLGDPDLGDKRLQLPGARQEAIRVGEMLKSPKVLLGREASLTALKAGAEGASLLHLAAHGLFEPENPLDSGILLTPGPSDDGRLRASDLYAWRLASPLVALSACESGLGETRKGDDVIGLNRGFLFAGARAVLSSLWEVSDESTLLLMTEFYRNLGSMQPSLALREAVKSVRVKYAHPFFWAAFVLTAGN